MNLSEHLNIDVLAITSFVINFILLLYYKNTQQINTINFQKIAGWVSNIDKTINPENHTIFSGTADNGIIQETKEFKGSITADTNLAATILVTTENND